MPVYRVGIGAGGEEQFDDGHMALLDRSVERRVVDVVRGARVGAGGQFVLDRGYVAVQSVIPQRRAPVLIDAVTRLAFWPPWQFRTVL